MQLARLQQCEMSKKGIVATRVRVTKALIRAKCADCLNLEGNHGHGFDCLVPACSLYRAMPWLGKEMPAHLKDGRARRSSPRVRR